MLLVRRFRFWRAPMRQYMAEVLRRVRQVTDSDTVNPRLTARRDSNLIGPLVAAVTCLVVAAALVPSVLPHGAGLTPDSATYGAAARSLAEGRGYLDVDGVSPMLDFPPMYPLLLAPVLMFGAQPGTAAAIVGIASALALALLLLAWSRELGLSRFGQFAVAVVSLTLPPMVDSYTSMLSEAPFIALWTGSCWMLTRVLQGSRHPRRDLAILTALLASAGLTRYLGLALIVGVCVCLLGIEGTRRRRATTALTVAVGAASPLAIWLIRNKIQAGTFTAPDYGASRTSLGSHLFDDLTGIGAWLVGDSSDSWSLVVGIAVVLLPVGICVFATRRRPIPGTARRPVTAVAVVSLAYLTLLLMGQTLVGLDTDDRFVRPLAPTLVLLVAVTATRPARLRGKAVRTGAAALTLLLVGAHSVPGVLQHIDDGEHAGLADYNASRWQHSSLLAALRTHPPKRILVSNDAYAVSLLARLPVEQSPATVYDNSSQPTGDLEQFQNDVQDQPRTLAWFNNPDVGQLVTLDNLAKAVCLKKVQPFDDGLLLETCGSVPRGL